MLLPLDFVVNRSVKSSCQNLKNIQNPYLILFFCRAYVKGDVAWHDYDLVKITHQSQYHTLECLSFIKLGKCHLLLFLSYLEEPTYLASLLYFDSNIIQILYSGKVVEDGIQLLECYSEGLRSQFCKSSISSNIF